MRLIRWRTTSTSLRAVGAYDQSLIILKSDHGEPVSYNDPDTIESFRIRDHPLWGYGRYAPLLAIKNSGVSREAPSFDDHPVLLDDLAKTICVSSGIDVDCARYNGVDVLGGQWTGIGQAEITMFIVASGERSGSDYRYDAHVPITFSRGSDILESLHGALSAELLRSSVSCGQRLRVDRGVPLDNGRSDMGTWLTWRDDGSSFLRFRLDEACRDARLLVGTDAAGAAARDLKVMVNGNAVDDAVPEATGKSVGDNSSALLDISNAMAGLSGDVVIQIQPVGPGHASAVPIVGLDLD